jgi:hypothetical protein
LINTYIRDVSFVYNIIEGQIKSLLSGELSCWEKLNYMLLWQQSWPLLQ